MSQQIEPTDFGKALVAMGWTPNGNDQETSKKAGAEKEKGEAEGKLNAEKEMLDKLSKENKSLKKVAEERLEALGKAAVKELEQNKKVKYLEEKLKEASERENTNAEKFAKKEKELEEIKNLLEIKQKRAQSIQDELDMLKIKIMEEHQKITQIIGQSEIESGSHSAQRVNDYATPSSRFGNHRPHSRPYSHNYSHNSHNNSHGSRYKRTWNQSGETSQYTPSPPQCNWNRIGFGTTNQGNGQT